MAAGSSLTSRVDAMPLRRSSREHLKPKMQSKQSAGHARTVRGKKAMSVLKLWDDQQMIQLSKDVYHFKAHHGRLPDTSDREFWAWCCACFNGRFTVRQLRYKVLRLKLRHEQISRGRARIIKLSEKATFDIWTTILLSNVDSASAPAPKNPGGPPLCDHGASHYTIPPPYDGLSSFPQAAPCTSSLSNASATPPPMQDQGQSAAPAPPPPRSSCHVHADQTPGDEEEVGGMAGGGAEEHTHNVQGSSTSCAVKDTMQGQQENLNFQHSFLYHTTVADLASTTKKLAEATCMLAEIVQSNGPPK